MVGMGLFAAVLCGSGLLAMGEGEEIAKARLELEQAIVKDSDFGEDVTQLMNLEDWEGVTRALEERYPELACSDWNDTWYEEPRDVVHGLTHTFGTGMGLLEWFESQEWRSFLSPVGKPRSRATQNVNLMYVTVRGNGTKGAVVFSLGRDESIRKYDEIAYDFIAMGYSPLYIYTHRGQGESDRLLDTSPYRAYVESHQDYTHDLRAFTELVAEEMAASGDDKDKPLYMCCHSMGCGIALKYLIEEYEAQRQPRYFGVALVAPNVKPNTGSWPLSVAISISDILVSLGQGRAYAPGRSATFAIHHPNRFPINHETHSFTRYKREKEKCMQFEDVPLGVDQHPGLCNYGLSTRWVKELFDQYREDIVAFRKIYGKKLEVPLLMMTAGDEYGTDGLVMNGDAKVFCLNQATDCTNVNFPGGMHWLYGSSDELRDRVFAELDSFFGSHSYAPVTVPVLPPGLKAIGEGCNRDRQCMSRFCGANFAWDIFGGKCKPKATFLDGSLGQRTPILAALATAAAVAAAFAGW